MKTNRASKEICVLSGLAYSVCGVAQERLNITVSLVDDMGLMGTSVPFLIDENGQPAHHPLNDWYHTPNMERLAKQGTCFSTFYVQSVNSPSRALIMTGQNATRHGVTNRINVESNSRIPFGPPEWNWKGLREDMPTMPKVLQQAGYKTTHVGKAHFGCIGSEGENPLHLGFDVSITGSGIGHPGSYCGEWGYGHIKRRKVRAVPDLEKYHGADTFLSEALVIEANREITKAAEEKHPLYLNMAHYAVHAPFQADKRLLLRYTDPDKSEQARASATLIEGMDKSLGDIVDQLEKLGVTENTSILLLGDNGGNAPLGNEREYNSSAPLRGKKGMEFEGGMRVPFIMGWAKPEKESKVQKRLPIEAGGMQVQLGTIMDIYPTVLAVAGRKAPQGYAIDGFDLKKQLSDKVDWRRPESFLMHFPHAHRGNYFTTHCMGGQKLTYYYLPGTPQQSEVLLYNLKDDPEERNGLSSAYPDKCEEMVRKMSDQLVKEGALYPTDKQGNESNPLVYF